MKKLLIILALSSNAAHTFASPMVDATKMDSSAVAAASPYSMKANASAPTTLSSNGVSVVSIACDAGSPCYLVYDTTNKILGALNTKNITTKQAATMVQEIAEPQFDFTLMTRYALGNNWKLASPEQQIELVDAFKSLLVFTYSAALTKFKNAQITINSSEVTDKKAVVLSKVFLPNVGNGGNQSIAVEYDLANMSKTPTPTWLAYDVKIENASLVTTYRNQFNDIVQANGIDGLISQLKAKVSGLQKATS